MVDNGLKRLLKVLTKGAAHVAAANLEEPKPLTNADKVDVGVKLTKKIFGRYFDKGGDTTQKETKRRSKRSARKASPTRDRRSERHEANDPKTQHRRRRATAQFEKMAAPDKPRRSSENERRPVFSASRPSREYDGLYHEHMEKHSRAKRSSEERRPNAKYPEDFARRQSHKPDTKTPRSPDEEIQYRRSSHGGPTSPQSTGPTKKHRRRNSHHEGRTGDLDTEVPIQRTHSQRSKPTNSRVPIDPVDTSHSRHSKAGESPRDPRRRGGIEGTEDQRYPDDERHGRKPSDEMPIRIKSRKHRDKGFRPTSGSDDKDGLDTSTTAVLDGEHPIEAGPRFKNVETDKRADTHGPVSPSKSRKQRHR